MQIETSINVEDNSDIIKNACAEAIHAALNEAGLHLMKEAADELENPPRRVDTGRLKGSVTRLVDGDTLYVGTNVEYGIYVHEGTRRMDPNPFLKNAFERNEEQIKRYILDRLQNY